MVLLVPCISYSKDIVDIKISPEYFLFENDLSKAISVKAVYDDGSIDPIENSIIYSSSNESVAKIDSEGNVYPISNGTTSIKIFYGSHSVFVGVDVNVNGLLAIDTDKDGMPDASDPLPYIALSTSSGIKLGNMNVTYAKYSVLGSMSFDTFSQGALNNYILSKGAKVTGNIFNDSSINIELVAAYLLVPESNIISTGLSFYVANRTLRAIAGTSDVSLLSGGVLSPGENVGLSVTLNQDIDIRGYGIRWLWIINGTPGDTTSQVHIISDPPIVSDFDNDNIFDHIDPDDDNDGLFDVEEIDNFLNYNNAIYASKFIANKVAVRHGETINFKNFSTGHNYASFWYFSDGTTSEEKNPTHIFVKPGIYDVQLTVYQNGGLIPTWGASPEQVKLRENYIKVFPDKGDIDYSGNVDLKDTISALNVLVNSSGGNSVNLEGVDVNLDGRIGLAEAIQTLQKVSGQRIQP